MKASDLTDALEWVLQTAAVSRAEEWLRPAVIGPGQVRRVATTAARACVETGLEQEVAVAQPERLLATLKALGDEEVSLSAEGGRFSVRCGHGDYAFALANAEDIPDWPEVNAKTELQFDTQELHSLLKAVAFAAQDEYGHSAALEHILLEARGGKIAVAATDGARLAMAEREAAMPEGRWLLPKGLLEALSGLVGTAVLGMGDKQLTFHAGEYYAVFPKPLYEYPDVFRVLAGCAEPDWRGKVNAETLAARLRAVRAASAAEWVWLRFGASCIVLRVEGDNTALIEVPTEGTEFAEVEKAFNLKYLVDGFGRCTGEVVLALKGEMLLVEAAGWRYIQLAARVR